ncbi:MAG: response regulator transcription factor [Clostridia bacterium]|nr:response regulator transcription factor [Clostridia bacterium]
MLRHIVVFIYIFGSFLGMTGIFLYWLMSKKKDLKIHADESKKLRKFMISTFLIGLLSFFTFYSQYIMFFQPTNTTFRILDYLLWVFFIFYWIDYLDSVVEGFFLHKMKRFIQYGCLGYVVIWLFTTAQIWDIDFYIVTVSSRILFTILDMLFCLLSIFVVVIYVIRGQYCVKNRFSGFYIFAVSIGLMAYTIWEFTHYAQLFSGLSAPRAWQINPFNATAFFLFYTNLVTLIYVYHNEFSDYFLSENQSVENDVPENESAENEAPENRPLPAEASSESLTADDIASKHNLTPREKEVMEYVYKGFNNAEIAEKLFISQNTVKHHIYNLFKKLEINNRIELICLLQEYYS